MYTMIEQNGLDKMNCTQDEQCTMIEQNEKDEMNCTQDEKYILMCK